jgi:hypothetical protein
MQGKKAERDRHVQSDMHVGDIEKTPAEARDQGTGSASGRSGVALRPLLDGEALDAEES